MHYNLQELVKQWDRLSSTATSAGQEYAAIDSLHWLNYLAFDIIGDLVNNPPFKPTSTQHLSYTDTRSINQAFGAPFDMLPKGKDIAEVRKTPSSPPTYAPAIEVLNRRGEVSGTLGCLPALKPYAKYLPDRFFRDGLEAVENLAGIAVARVNERLRQTEEGQGANQRVDLLARLMEGRDENGNKLGQQELTAEALTQLIAGSDTTSNTSCALFFWVLKTPGVMEKLQRELDAAIPEGVTIPHYEMVKDLP